jgi:uncharacterized membrane protein
LTPRIIATTLLRDNVIRSIVGVFVYGLLIAVAVKNRMDAVPRFMISLAAIWGLVSTVAFLILIDYAARLLRPVTICWLVGERGLKVIQSIYPRPIDKQGRSTQARQELGPADRIVEHRGTSAVVLAVNLEALIAEAQRADGIIEFAPRVGDFVAVGEPLLLLRGGAAAIPDRKLRGQVAWGSERTIEQDSTFAFRIIVDIAIKALSKAINDPTTAVLAIDQLHRLLRMVGLRHLHNEELFDADGKLRVIYFTPNWEDFVHLGCTEIRHCGASSVQIMRRMRSMLENLMQALPPHRHAELQRQLDLLDRTVEASYAFAEDRALARIADPQGLGGPLGVKAVEQKPV